MYVYLFYIQIVLAHSCMLRCFHCRDGSYPRLGNLVVEYEHPVKKLVEDFNPISRVPKYSLRVCVSVYVMIMQF